MFKTLKTSGDEVKRAQKTLLYGHHGWGKTTQAMHLQEMYGKAFILSGEAGLSSLSHHDIDYLVFNSWHDAKSNNPDAGKHSLVDLRRIIESDEFKAQGYKVIVLDSLTEASDMLLSEAKYLNRDNKNTFAVWDVFATEMIGYCKWFRDLDYHVLVTSLAKEEKNDNGGTEYWPMVANATTRKQLPGIFDNVFAGVRVTEDVTDDEGRSQGVRVERFIVCDQYGGWHCKVRDPLRRLTAVERTGSIAELYKKMETTNVKKGDKS